MRLIVVLLVLTAASTARADAIKDCTKGPPAQSILGCTTLLAKKSISKANRAVAHYNRALAYHGSSECELAILDYTETLRYRLNDAKSLRGRASCYKHLRQWDEAIRDFAEAIRNDPRDYHTRVGKASVYEEMKDYLSAVGEYSGAINFFPKDPILYRFRGIAWARSAYVPDGDKQNLTHAISDFTTAIQFSSTDAQSYGWRGLCHEAQKNRDLAIADYVRAIGLDKNNRMSYDGLVRLGILK